MSVNGIGSVNSYYREPLSQAEIQRGDAEQAQRMAERVKQNMDKFNGKMLNSAPHTPYTRFKAENMITPDMKSDLGVAMNDEEMNQFLKERNLGTVDELRGRFRDLIEAERNNPSKITINEDSFLNPRAPILDPNGPYDKDGFATDRIYDFSDISMYNRDWLTHALETGKTSEVDIRLVQGAFSGETNIPEENFLDEGVKRYEELYNQIQSLNVDAPPRRLIVSELDRAFINYSVDAFNQAGLSAESAEAAGNGFAKAFRLSLTSGSGIEDSYLAGLRKLNEANQGLNQAVRYTSHIDTSI